MPAQWIGRSEGALVEFELEARLRRLGVRKRIARFHAQLEDRRSLPHGLTRFTAPHPSNWRRASFGDGIDRQMIPELHGQGGGVDGGATSCAEAGDVGPFDKHGVVYRTLRAEPVSVGRDWKECEHVTAAIEKARTSGATDAVKTEGDASRFLSGSQTMY